MSFTCVKDQEAAIRLLRRVLERQRIPNAMLFWGPGGVGKLTTAMELAKAINCTAGAGDACNACLPCRKIANSNHPDVQLIVPSDKVRVIKKGKIEEINELASLRPFESKWRIFILQDADRMNQAAQNHFLKTLEEPPGQSLFLLLTEYPRTLLPTIRSRCQMVRFRCLRTETVVAILREQRDLPDQLAESIAAVAGGQMTRALDLVDTDRREVVLALVSRLGQGDDPVDVAEEFAAHLAARRKQMESAAQSDVDWTGPAEADPEDMERLKEERTARVNALVNRDRIEYLYLLTTWYRDELVCAALGESGRAWNRDRMTALEGNASSDPETKIQAIETARVHLELNVPEDRVFRDLFLTLAQP